MKILNFALLTLLCPIMANAGTVIYADDFANSKSSVQFNGLADVVDNFNLNVDANNFRLKDKQKSLLGTHYTFQQMVGDKEVADAQIIVSVDKNGEVTKIYDSSNKKASMKVSMLPFITQEKAIELAWNKLQVNGEFLDSPIVKLLVSSDMRLIYKVTMGTSSPFGYWEITLDAHNGDIISVTDAYLPRMKKANSVYGQRKLNLKPISFNAALKKIQQEKMNAASLVNTVPVFATGSALVFDPNPAVTLGRTDLQDTMDASVFLPAYKEQELKDITFENSVYTLKGPKITLIDFESPKIAPSTTTDGVWTANRGNVAFNDAMTYLHLDRSLRYIESLGFVGEKALFKKSLEVDANGVNGDDNSHYIPSVDRLAFGHGCVDDNEDTDVILHELGHAIQTHINSSWNGGDTGGMGEGFGDYWAASYSVTRPNGMDIHPEWVYKWDGHNRCWAGRKMDSFLPKYNPKKKYGAHSNVDGGNSDELWSTPIFQSFLELYKRGVPREVMDRIILESHFGLGYGVKIPQMAQSIVNTAKALYPNEDYDQVYLKYFNKMGIL